MSSAALYEPVVPSTDDSRIAKQSRRTLARYACHSLSVRVANTNETVELPEGVVRLLVDILENMAEGNAVTLIPVHAELTTRQAADFLGVSRPFLIRLLEDGAIPYRKVCVRHRAASDDGRLRTGTAETRTLSERRRVGEGIEDTHGNLLERRRFLAPKKLKKTPRS